MGTTRASASSVRLRRHARWFVPLIAGAVGYAGFMWWASLLVVSPAGGERPDVVRSLAALGVMGLALITPATALVFTIVGAVTTFREWRRGRRIATGRLNARERTERARDEHLAAAWSASQHLRSALIRREIPPQIRIWDVVPEPEEVFFLDTTAAYARFYGQTVTYTQSSGFFFGHPLFVAAGLAASAAGNSRRRSAAENAAREQWREHQTVRLIVSNQRLICHVNGQWLSFFYSAMTAVYPEVDKWSLVCQFPATSPLLLSGADVPSAAVIAVLMTYGPDAVAEHPSLLTLGR